MNEKRVYVYTHTHTICIIILLLHNEHSSSGRAMCSIVRGKTKTPGKTSTHTNNFLFYFSSIPFVSDSPRRCYFFSPSVPSAELFPLPASNAIAATACQPRATVPNIIVSSMCLHTRRTCRQPRSLRQSIIIVILPILAFDFLFRFSRIALYDNNIVLQ